MTDVALFGVGLLVTLLVAAAVVDGHENDQARAERSAPDATGGGPSPRQSLTSAP